MPWGFSTTDIGPRAIVGQPFMCWRNSFPARDGLHCSLSWKKHELRFGDSGQGRAPFETKDFLKNRGYTWSPGEFGRPRCWYRDVSDADKAAEVVWLRANVLEPDQAVWALRITARDRYSDRCWGWGEPLGISLECAVDRPGRRWYGAMTPEVVREGQNDTLL